MNIHKGTKYHRVLGGCCLLGGCSLVDGYSIMGGCSLLGSFTLMSGCSRQQGNVLYAMFALARRYINQTYCQRTVRQNNNCGRIARFNILSIINSDHRQLWDNKRTKSNGSSSASNVSNRFQSTDTCSQYVQSFRWRHMVADGRCRCQYKLFHVSNQASLLFVYLCELIFVDRPHGSRRYHNISPGIPDCSTGQIEATLFNFNFYQITNIPYLYNLLL